MKNKLSIFFLFLVLGLLFVPASNIVSAQSTCLPTGRIDIPYTTTGDELSPRCFPTSKQSSSSTASSSATAAPTCSANVNSIGDFICKIGVLIRSIIPLLVMLGVVYFVWGVVQYMIGGGEETKKKGREKVIYGLIGLVVIAGLAGLVAIIVNTFGLSQGNLGLISTSSVFNQNTQSSSNFGLCNLTPNNPNFQQLVSYITCIIGKSVIPLIFAMAVAMFVWGVVQYVINSSEEAKKEKGRQFMIWGIIALVVMVSVWGLVSIVAKTFNINITSQVQTPGLSSQPGQ